MYCPRCGGRMFYYASSFVWLCPQCGYEEPDHEPEIVEE